MEEENSLVPIFSPAIDEKRATSLSPLTLAFVGDGVWTLFVRDFFCKKTDFKNSNLHSLTTRFVKASFQANALDRIDLTNEEKTIARRARNAHNNTIAKNATLLDYKKATSFEAVVGYLYLTGNTTRLKEIFSIFLIDLQNILKK